MTPKKLALRAILATLVILSAAGALYWRAVSPPDPSRIPSLLSEPPDAEATVLDAAAKYGRADSIDASSGQRATREEEAAIEPGGERGSGVIRGIVQTEMGLPLPGVSLEAVRILTPGTWHPKTESVARETSDESGIFSLEGLPAGEYALRAFSTSHRPAEVPELQVSPRGATEVVVELRGGLEITGRVVDPTGEPVIGARVESHLALRRMGPIIYGMTHRDDLAWAAGDLGVLTDEDGRFRLERLPSGNRRILVRHADWAPTVVEPVAAGSRDLVVQVDRGTTIHGKVSTIDGEPIADASVSIYLTEEMFLEENQRASVSVRTDEDGEFHSGPVRSGTAEIVVQATGYPRWVSDDLVLHDGKTLDGVEIVLAEPSEVSGRIVDTAGRPIEGVQVSFFSAQRPPERSRAESDAEGWFVAPTLSTGREYRWSASHPDFRDLRGDPFVLHVDVDLGTIELEAGLTLPGRVVTPTAQPLSSATVVLERRLEGHWTTEGERTVVDVDGTFAFSGLPAGEFRVAVKARGWAAKKSEPAHLAEGAGVPDVVVVLGGGPDLAGGVVDDRGLPVVGARVTAGHRTVKEATTYTDAVGQFSFGGFGDNPTLLRAHYRGSTSATRVAHPGTPAELVLQRDGSVSGRVRDVRTGGPVTPLRIFLDDRAGPRYGSGAVFRNPGGSFVFTDVAPGKWFLTVYSPGYVPREVELAVRPGEQRTVEIGLSPGIRVEGVVVDEEGRPVAEARVCAAYDGDPGDSSRPGGNFFSTAKDGSQFYAEYSELRADAVLTDEEGRFELRGLRAGKATFRVEHDDFLDGEFRPVSLLDGEPVRIMAPLRLDHGSGVAGSVHSSDGTPHRKGLVVIQCVELAPEPPREFAEGGEAADGEKARPPCGGRRFVPLDARGRYRQTGLLPGRYRVGHWEDASSTTEIDLAADEIRTVDLRLRPGRR